jgi:hypothetical protein
MLAMVPGHTVLALLTGTAVVTWERLARLPRMRVTATALAAAGTLTLAVAALPHSGTALAVAAGHPHPARAHERPAALLCPVAPELSRRSP